jgi:hypothetical protein
MVQVVRFAHSGPAKAGPLTKRYEKAVMNITNKIKNKLNELGLADLNSRPYDSSHSVLEGEPSSRKLIVVGFNGSDADLEWTNISAIEHGEKYPLDSNVINGANGGWLSTTLPKRLLSLPEELGFDTCSTVFTNAILLCSEDANAVKNKAVSVGFKSINDLIEKSLDFFENITIAESEPDLIIAYSNSLNDLSAASILYQKFGVSEISYSNESPYYNTFSFKSKIAGKQIPVVCIRHMSRYKPCMESIKKAWSVQTSAAIS